MSEFSSVTEAFWWYWASGFVTAMVLHIGVLPGALFFRGLMETLKADRENG